MTRKYVHGGTSQRSFLSVESLEDRSVPSTTSLDALGVPWLAPIPEIHPPAAIAPVLLDVASLAITPPANGPIDLMELATHSIPAVLPVGNLSAGVETVTLDPVANIDPVKDISLIVPLPELVAVLPPLVTPLLEPVAPILSPLLPPPATPPADPPPPIAPLPVPPPDVAPVLDYVAPLLPSIAPLLTPPSDTPPPGAPPSSVPLPVLAPVAVVTETVAQLLPPVAPLLEPAPPPPDAPPASTPPPIVSLPAPPPSVAPVPESVASPVPPVVSPPVLLPPGAPPPPASTPPPVVPATHVPPPREHSESPAEPAAPQVGPVAPPTEFAPPPPLFSPRGEAGLLHNKSEGLPALHGAALAAEEANNSASASDSVPRQSSNPVPDAPQGLTGTPGAYRLTLGDDTESSDPLDLPALAGGMVLEGRIPNADPVSPCHNRRASTEASEEPELVDSGAAEMLESAPLPDLGGLEGFLAGLDRLGLPAGEGMRGWLLATALAAMACEVARRQMRTPRSGAQSAEDVADTLSWSLTLSGCS